MKIPIIVWLLQGIPENLAMASFVISMSGQRLKLNTVLTIGLVQAILIYLVRLLPVTFGIHTIIAIISLGILLHLITKTRLGKSLLYSLLAYALLAFAEIAFVNLIFILSGSSLEHLFENQLLTILAGWLQVLAIFFIALAIQRWRKRPLPQGVEL